MSGAIDYEKRGLIPPTRRPALPGEIQTAAEVLDPVLKADPEREALVGRHGRYSYAELDLAANRAANAMAALGVAPGDRVAFCLPNDTEMVIGFLAAMRLGALWVGINRVLAAPEKAYILADCEACLLVTESETAESLSDQRAEVPGLRHLLTADRGAREGTWFEACSRAPASRPATRIDPFAPAAIAYTSGTTGFPKGAVHSQHNLLLPGAVHARLGNVLPDEPLGVVLPLTILNLQVLGTLSAYQVGTCCVAMDRIDAVGVAEWVETERIGTFAGVPAIIHDLLTHPDVKPEQLATLKRPLVGGAECPESFRALYRERFGCEVSIGYGMTEAPTAVTWGEGASQQPGFCGAALPQICLSIRDAENRELPPGEVGEICVGAAESGDWAGIYTPMLGYWNKPEATAEALAGGVLHSADLGLLDEDGVLFIRGRTKELILRGGANVYPAEVERVLQSDPRIAACAVLGRSDPRLGARIAAVVQPAPGAAISREELRALCEAQLARYKVPEYYFFVTAMPRNAMNKIVKPRLQELVEGPGD